jgi:molecular chaperone HtpG
MSTTESIPFHVDIQRIVQILANQIYQSPLALLRENCQNAYDAILQRLYVDSDFTPEIRISVSRDAIVVSDNGIGMSADEIKNNYWQAGSSGKNNDAARAAGVVGTFGIGAMANFGIADSMGVVTEKLGGDERIESAAEKATLSATNDCIKIVKTPSLGKPGTVVSAMSTTGFDLEVVQAAEYVSSFVKHVPIAVYVNDQLVSQVPFDSDVPRPIKPVFSVNHTGVIHGTLQGKLEISGSANEIWVRLSDVVYGGASLIGEAVLRQNQVHIRGFRTKFALATSSTSSVYQFGGVADFNILEPTAGREALTTRSVQTLQQFVTAIEAFVSLQLAASEFSNDNQGFIAWAASNGRFDLCRNLVVRIEPHAQKVTLSELQTRPDLGKMQYYIGNDTSVVRQAASEDSPLVVLSRDGNRRNCELGFINKFCPIQQLDNRPKVTVRVDEWSLSLSQRAMVFQISTILKNDYFVDASVCFGEVSQPNLPFLIDPVSTPIDIVLVDQGSSVSTILQLYSTNYPSFTSFIKDFVRSVIFPQIANRVPSSTRQGAESFLQIIQRPREQFSIDDSVTGDLSEIWIRVNEGLITPEEAALRSQEIVQRNIQVVSQSDSVRNVVPDVIDNQAQLESALSDGQFPAMPAITRPQTDSDKILLTIAPEEQAINGFRTFLAVTERVLRDRGDFFLQPHFTQIVWGGQKVLYIFQHHSREFSLYYEVQAKEFVSDQPGGAAFATTTIAIRNQTYIPIPSEIASKFVPTNTPKEFYARCDLLFPEIDDA